MRKHYSYLLLLAFVPILQGCAVVETIFKAGMWWAFFLVFIVVAFIIWIIAKAKK